MKNSNTKYHLFRILFTSIFIYWLLTLPPMLFAWIKKMPTLVDLANKAGFNSENDHLIFTFSKESIAIFIIYIIINLPFKIYLRRLKKNKKIGQYLKKYTKKLLMHTPAINASLFFVAGMIASYFGNNFAYKKLTEVGAELPDIFAQIGSIVLLSNILVAFVVYLWQKNRVHLNYIDIFYSQEELKTKLRKRGGKLYFSFLFSTLVTTLLPIFIILFYLYINVSMIYDIVPDLKNTSVESKRIVYGEYYDMVQTLDSIATQKHHNNKFTVEKFFPADTFKYYYNSVDTYFMWLGIITSIAVSLIYIFLISRLNSRIVVIPLNELKDIVKRTANGEFGLQTTVRIENEIGDLTESFNKMSSNLKKYFDDLTDLNKNLEQKVIERTAYIEQQKEEIKAQRDEIEAQRDEVIKQRDTIFEQKKQITDSINYAKNIQNAILPSKGTLNSLIPNNVLYYVPRDIVSGDFYWIKKVKDKILLAVADCTGHGVPGALMSMLGISILNEIAAHENFDTPAQILEQLRKQIIVSLNQQGADNEAKDGMDIAMCMIDTKNKILQYSGANNQLIYFIDDRLFEIKATRTPVGIYRNPKPFENHIIKYTERHIFYLFSDGYRDQMDDNHKRIKLSGFKEILDEIHLLPFDIQYNILNKKFKDWKKDNEQTDDIIVFGFRLY